VLLRISKSAAGSPCKPTQLFVELQQSRKRQKRQKTSRHKYKKDIKKTKKQTNKQKTLNKTNIRIFCLALSVFVDAGGFG